jgi:Haemolysin-III related
VFTVVKPSFTHVRCEGPLPPCHVGADETAVDTAARPRRHLRPYRRTYTPFGLFVLAGDCRITVLAIAWSGSFLAIVIQFVWASAPKWVAAVIGIALGWLGVVVFPRLLDKTGTVAALLVLAGGLCYTLGALIYARRKPDPFPTASPSALLLCGGAAPGFGGYPPTTPEDSRACQPATKRRAASRFASAAVTARPRKG